MTMQQAAANSVPRLPLAWAFSVVIVTILVVTAARLTGFSPVQDLGASEVLQSKLLRFEDAGDGSVSIIDGTTGKLVASAEPGTNGFLRGTLRGLMRVRKKGEVSYGAPYRLERLRNGQLMLIDTASGIRLDLNAYGQTNAAVFAAFLSTTGDKS
jgi:putative photosynthetic complex assembly protein